MLLSCYRNKQITTGGPGEYRNPLTSRGPYSDCSASLTARRAREAARIIILSNAVITKNETHQRNSKMPKRQTRCPFAREQKKSDLEQVPKASKRLRQGSMGLGDRLYCASRSCLWLCSGHSHKVLDDRSYRLFLY